MNKRFGRLIVVSESEKRTKSRGVYWLCKCDCGATKEVASQHLVKGLTTSCGCYNKEVNLAKTQNMDIAGHQHTKVGIK